MPRPLAGDCIVDNSHEIAVAADADARRRFEEPSSEWLRYKIHLVIGERSHAVDGECEAVLSTNVAKMRLHVPAARFKAAIARSEAIARHQPPTAWLVSGHRGTVVFVSNRFFLVSVALLVAFLCKNSPHTSSTQLPTTTRREAATPNLFRGGSFGPGR